MILALRTDKPEAEVYLVDKEYAEIDKIIWLAHRELSLTILDKIDELLENNSFKLNDLEGIIVFEGPGSFTGLRIGIAVANTIAYSLKIPIIGAKEESWIKQGVENLTKNNNTNIVLPHYGSEPNITAPRK